MRSMLEAEHDKKRIDMNKMQMEYNKQLALQKKDREIKRKYDETNLDLYNISEAENKRSSIHSKLKNEIDEQKASI
jgi:hypothetical protein